MAGINPVYTFEPGLLDMGWELTGDGLGRIEEIVINHEEREITWKSRRNSKYKARHCSIATNPQNAVPLHLYLHFLLLFMLHASHAPNLLYLLSTSRQLQRHRLTPQPKRNKSDPPRDGNSNPRNPRPSAANNPTPWPLIMSKVSHSNSILLFNVREEWSLVIDHEIEDTVLVGEFEAGGVDGGVLSGGFWDEGEAVEG